MRGFRATIPAASCAAIPSPGWAQVVADPAAIPERGGLDDIVVTAQRRAENLQDVPVAVTAIGEEDLLRRSIANVAEVQRYTPSLNISSGRGTSSDAFIYIRGIGQNDDFFVADPAVGLYIDGVYSSRTQGSLLTFFDVERIEVLRGPQGTLYGKNTIAGAINVVSKLPDLNGVDYRVDAAIGSYRQRDVQASVSVPLAAGRAALRVSALYNYNKGFFRNVTRGERTNDRDLFGIRGTLLVQATDALSLTLRGDLTRDRSKARLGQIVGFDPTEAFVANLERATAPQRLRDFQLRPGQDVWVGGSELAPRADLDIWGASLTAVLDLGRAELKSITAYRDLEQGTNLDIDNSPLFIVNSIRDLRQWQATQEVQLSGKAVDGRLDWLLGGFYFTERATLGNDLPIRLGAVVTPAGPLDISNRRDAGARTFSYAGFGQATLRFAGGFSVTGGLRYTHERKDLRLRTSNPNTGRTTFDSAGYQRDGWNSFTPKIALDYKPAEGALLYASVQSGFKSGGFNARAPVAGALEAFRPEKAVSYELGAKSELFDRRLRLNVAGYRIDYEDLQLTVFRTVNNQLSQAVRNAGKARIHGLEVEAQARPADGLDLFAAYALTDANYREFIDNVGGVLVDKSGNRFVNTPRHQVTLGGQYAADLGTGGELSGRLDWAYQSRTWKDVDNAPALVQSGYGVTNARLAWSDAAQRVTVALIGRNLFDVEYLTTGAQVSSFGPKIGWFGDPRTVTVQLTLRR